MRRRNGFTLMELLITVLIIGILASLAFSKITWVIERAKSAEANDVLLKAYGGFRRILSDEDCVSTSKPLNWSRLGMTNPNLNARRNFDYTIDSLSSPTRVTAVSRTNSSRWLRVNLNDGCITKTQPY